MTSLVISVPSISPVLACNVAKREKIDERNNCKCIEPQRGVLYGRQSFFPMAALNSPHHNEHHKEKCCPDRDHDHIYCAHKRPNEIKLSHRERERA